MSEQDEKINRSMIPPFKKILNPFKSNKYKSTAIAAPNKGIKKCYSCN